MLQDGRERYYRWVVHDCMATGWRHPDVLFLVFLVLMFFYCKHGPFYFAEDLLVLIWFVILSEKRKTHNKNKTMCQKMNRCMYIALE